MKFLFVVTFFFGELVDPVKLRFVELRPNKKNCRQ